MECMTSFDLSALVTSGPGDLLYVAIIWHIVIIIQVADSVGLKFHAHFSLQYRERRLRFPFICLMQRVPNNWCCLFQS